MVIALILHSHLIEFQYVGVLGLLKWRPIKLQSLSCKNFSCIGHSLIIQWNNPRTWCHGCQLEFSVMPGILDRLYLLDFLDLDGKVIVMDWCVTGCFMDSIRFSDAIVDFALPLGIQRFQSEVPVTLNPFRLFECHLEGKIQGNSNSAQEDVAQRRQFHGSVNMYTVESRNHCPCVCCCELSRQKYVTSIKHCEEVSVETDTSRPAIQLCFAVETTVSVANAKWTK
jgi:hypothetical protein